MTRRARLADPAQLELPLFVEPAAASEPAAVEAAESRAAASDELAAPAGAPAPSTPLPDTADDADDARAALDPQHVRLAGPWRHPRAVREIDLGRSVVGYAFERARRRSIGMVVSDEGLSVRAPRWVSWGEIEAALREKAGWIEARLAEQHERARKLEAARITWCDGTSLPFLGETVIVVLDPRVTGAVLDAGADALPGVPRLTLHVGLPHTAAPEQIRDVVQAWLKRQALRIFEERCAHFAPQLGVRVTRLGLSSAQTRWGSASADGSVRLNWRLVHFALPTIDYVVAHELAHLREMNHGPRFWDVVRSVIPDVDGARGALRHETVPVLD